MIKLSQLVFMSIVMAIVVVGMIGFAGQMFDAYNVEDYSDLQSINKSIELGSRIETAYENFQKENVQDQWLGGTLVTGATVVWDTLLAFLTIPDIIGTFVSDVGAEAGIPSLILGAITLAIVTVVVVAGLYILTKVEW